MAEAAESPSRTAVSEMWTSRGPPPARVRVYDEEKLTELLEPGPAAQGSGMRSATSLRSAMRRNQRREKKRQDKEEEEQRVRRYERHRAAAARDRSLLQRPGRGRGWSADGSRRRRGCRADSPRRRFAPPPPRAPPG